MTLISALKFNKYHGAVIADERLVSDEPSSEDEKHDVDIKIYDLPKRKDVFGLLAGAGSSEEITAAVLSARDAVKSKHVRIKTGLDMAQQISAAMSTVRRQIVNDHFFNKYGLMEANYHIGKRKDKKGKLVALDETLWNNMSEEYESGDLKGKVDNEFITLTYGKEGLMIYRTDMDMVHPAEIEIPYDCIGSGGGKAGEVLYRFIKSFPREKRDDLPPLQGLKALLHGYERATLMTGVGGTPLIKIIREGQVITPSEENSHLAAEIVKGTARGYLNQSFEFAALESLLYKGADSQDIEKAMWKKAKKPAELSRFLRGYGS